jgi:uncharacterized protein (TIGR03067 family)
MRAMVSLGAWVLLLTLQPLGVPAQDKAAKEEKLDPAKLVGTWVYVSGVKNGEKLDQKHFGKDDRVSLTKETITLTGEAGKFVMKYTLDAKKSPATISMEMTESPFGAGATATGIVQVEGDQLTICYAAKGPAPTKFEAKEGSGFHLFVLKRTAKD